MVLVKEERESAELLSENLAAKRRGEEEGRKRNKKWTRSGSRRMTVVLYFWQTQRRISSTLPVTSSISSLELNRRQLSIIELERARQRRVGLGGKTWVI